MDTKEKELETLVVLLCDAGLGSGRAVAFVEEAKKTSKEKEISIMSALSMIASKGAKAKPDTLEHHRRIALQHVDKQELQKLGSLFADL